MSTAETTYDESDESHNSRSPSSSLTPELEEIRSHFYWTSADDFIKEFFPESESIEFESEMRELEAWQEKMGTKDKEGRTVAEVYQLITGFLNFLWKETELECLDVHLRPDPKEYDGVQSENTPDFIAVKTEELKPERDCCRNMNQMCWEHCQLIADAKYYDCDPFVRSKHGTEEALKQALRYLADFTYFQHRTSCHLILFAASEARIVRWNPKQTICTEPFDFADRHQFEKFCRFVRFYGSPEANRGVDAHFNRAERTVAEDAADFFNKNKEIITQAGFVVPKASDIWELNLPALSPPNAPCSTPSMQLIVGRISQYHLSLSERNGKYFVGYEKEKLESLYFVKTNWAYVWDGGVSESDVYDKLKESEHVQKMIYGGCPKNVQDCMYTVKNSLYAATSGKEQPPDDNGPYPSWEGPEGKRPDPDQRLHFLVLPFARSLSTFRNAYELVEGIHGGLQGLLDMYLAGYLHRDVSPSNVGLKCSGDGVKGVLQDFDFALQLDTSSRSRAGTYLYQAAEVLERTPPVRQLIHDIESFYHVLTIHTFSNLCSDRRKQAKHLVESYHIRWAAAVKHNEIQGCADGFYDDEIIENINILGPIISLFRQFLASQYYREGRFQNVLAEHRKDQVIQLCSKVSILPVELDEFLQEGFIDATSFNTLDEQEKLLRFLIHFLELVIKYNRNTLEEMVINEGDV
ncbi:hypothetical protein BT69DRAFT_1350300 [Atractiella rhizophila]|nr:hypothetical protein BT69DRAFT_1350300 [Atractiella rhizophila]